LGEPHAHKTIELRALEVQDPCLASDMETNFRSLAEPQRFALETYSGNWMRDFSQVFVPMVMDICKCVKKDIGLSKPWKKPADNTTIGPVGAEYLITALLKVIATIELGETIGTDVITPKNLGPYKTEDHMDNPAGLHLSEMVIRAGKEKVTSTEKTSASEGKPQVSEEKLQAYVTASEETHEVSAAKQKELGSYAFPGKLELEEPILYEVGSSGFANHIYGTIEWVKQTFIEAAKKGSKDPRMNRANFGKGLHGVEDYFGHSNFVEVAINSVREPKEVPDTLFERIPPQKQKQQGNTPIHPRCYRGDLYKQPITTGTFGTLDTVVSLAHAVLPLIDVYYNYLDKAIDIFLGLIEEDKASTWEKIKEKSSEYRAAIALAILLEGMDKAGITLPVLDIETIRLDIPPINMLLPEDILKYVKGVDYPVRIGSKRVPPTKAVEEYKRYYEIIQRAMPLLEKLKEEITEAILNALPAEVREMIELYENLKDAYERFRKWLKEQIRIIIIKVVIEGILNTTPEEFSKKKHKKLEEWAEDTRGLVMEIMEYTTHITGKTALEVRIESGDLVKERNDAKLIPKHEGGAGLPPSHSEICKDHPPESHRSIFYELHIDLATKADKHLMVLMHNIWREVCPETWIVRNPSSLLDEAELAKLDQEAAAVAEREKDRASLAKRKFAQKDEQNLSPSMIKLLNAVDLYISHPDESDWWVDTVKNYTYKIEEDIKERNKTRNNRQLKDKPKA
jgi:hypothetical protein